MTEKWRKIPDTNGRYIVSDKGRVASSYNRGRCSKNRDVDVPDGYYLLKKHRNPSGYDTVSLCVNGKRKIITVHRLVMQVFVGPSAYEVNHINENKTDNRMINLEYVTSSANHIHSLAKPIERIDPETNMVRAIYASITAAQEDGYNTSGIHSACNGDSETYRGYIWRFHNEFR